MRKKHFKLKKFLTKKIVFFVLGVVFLFSGLIVLWVGSLKLPDFKLLNEKQLQSSTKIYDRTGEILLYDIHRDVKRTVIKSEDMGVNIKNATVAIEDSEFYQHRGIRISSIIRATIWAKLTGKKIQGGSTITQQLVKNTLLTKEKSITRKIKEWIISIKIEKTMPKEEILALYLNAVPYGGSIYGIKEASNAFFGKEPINLSLAESAYLAAIPNGPTYFSPYGKNKDKLEDRKNLVLKRMLAVNFITEEEYNNALLEKVTFLPQQISGIRAPHFVFFIKDYLEKKYGVETVESGGLKVITTLDYDLQQKAEKIVLEKAKENEKNWNGSNAGVVVIDPKTGQVLAMVGSRDYFDKEIDGNFNVATAERQPGSSFKPIVYALAFEKGFTEKTTLFDVRTEFNPTCSPGGSGTNGSWGTSCYSPDNYDGAFRGPMSLRNALAQSINIIAVKLLYLVGVKDSIKLAHELGITTLNDPDRYGLTLVIGGGETTLLDMTSVYGVFASGGIRHPHQSIISISDENNNVLEKYEEKQSEVISQNTTKILSSILSDNTARTPTFGPSSSLVVPGYDVAVKTGTTNSNRDAWTIGYTPSVVVGVWVGNNNNTPMKKGGAALAGPIWNGVITEALKKVPVEKFIEPDPINESLPPVLRGSWQGGEVYVVDSVSGGLATPFTPNENKKEIIITDVHTILHWLDKDNILDSTKNGRNDSQYDNWEYGIINWWNTNKYKYKNTTIGEVPTFYDNIHTEENKPIISISGLSGAYYQKSDLITFSIEPKSKYQIKKIDVYINDIYFRTLKNSPYTISFSPQDFSNILETNTIKILGYDTSGNIGEQTTSFYVGQ